MPVAQVHTMHERLENNAHALGMTWSLDTAKPTNTFDAHRVIALASSQGLGDEASERLFRAYFCEGELVSDHQRLSGLAGEVGVSDVDGLWESDAFAVEVRADEAAAQELGVTGVPCFLMDSKFMVSGAQGTEQILDVLNGLARRAPSPLLRSAPRPPSPRSGLRRGSSPARPSRHGPGRRPRAPVFE